MRGISIHIYVNGEQGRQKLSVFLDSGSHINVISQRTVLVLVIERLTDVELPLPQWIQDQRCHCYGVFDESWTAVDSWGSRQTTTSRFYTLDVEDYNLILGAPALNQVGAILDMGAKQWRYGISVGRTRIETPEGFNYSLKK